jgi:hypothetical protein
MRKIKEVVRLHFEAGLSERQISKISVLGKGTVMRREFLRSSSAELERSKQTARRKKPSRRSVSGLGGA